MSLFRSALPLWIVLLAAASSAHGQRAGSRLIDQAAAARQGLERSWFAQVELDSSRGEIEYATLHVNSSVTFKVFEVRSGESVWRFSSHHLDRFGDPLGEEGARRKALDWTIGLRAAGESFLFEEIDVPEVTLYVQTSRALLHAIDAETGRTRWAVRVGRPDYPSAEPAASDEFVAVVNGSNLYLLDADSGRLKWEQQVIGPGAGPAIGRSRVFVPKFNGMLEGHSIEDRSKPPSRYRAAGRMMIQPTVTSDSVSWPTDRGWLYVADADDGEIRFRVETHGEIIAPSLYGPPNRLYFTSIDGYVYCVDERKGDIFWRFSTGQPISEPAVPIASDMYVITDESKLYSVDTETGLEQWWAPNLKQFLAASENRVYCLDKIGQLVILDTETGGRIGSMNVGTLDFFFINSLTDRIYLGTRSGSLQCLRESDAEFPLVHHQRAPLDQEPEPAGIPEEPAAPADPTELDENPFDPFAEEEGDVEEADLEEEEAAFEEEEGPPDDGDANPPAPFEF